MPREAADVLRGQLRSTAILCAILGPVLLMMSATTYAAVKLIAHARAQPDIVVPAIPLQMEVVLAFADRSAGINVSLGILLGLAGWRGVRAPASGRRWLVAAGGLALVAMFVLAWMWHDIAVRAAVQDGWDGFGVVVHLAQAALVARALVFLCGRPLRDALSSPAGASGGSGR